MVYERLPRHIKHRKFPARLGKDSEICNLALVSRCLPVSILATCRQVFDEANEIVQKLAREFVAGSEMPVRLLYIHDYHNADEEGFQRLETARWRLVAALEVLCAEVRTCNALGESEEQIEDKCHLCVGGCSKCLYCTQKVFFFDETSEYGKTRPLQNHFNYMLNEWLPEIVRRSMLRLLLRSLRTASLSHATIEIMECHYSGDSDDSCKPLLPDNYGAIKYNWETAQYRFWHSARWLKRWVDYTRTEFSGYSGFLVFWPASWDHLREVGVPAEWMVKWAEGNTLCPSSKCRHLITKNALPSS